MYINSQLELWQITLKWKDLLFSSSSGAVTLNLTEWLSRATLDAIAEGEKTTSCVHIVHSTINVHLAAFDYKVGAMDDADNELARGYNNLM